MTRSDRPTERDDAVLSDWRDRLVALAEALPEVAVTNHPGATFKVRKKTIAYFVIDHHGDDRVALWFKAGPGVQQELVDTEPDRFSVPPYVGPSGWVALDLEAAPIDWDEVDGILRDSYRIQAPKTLARTLDAPPT